MEKGTNIGLIPGGFEEATLTTQTALRIYIKNRKGFVKMALKYGYKISPVLTLGENMVYKTLDRFTKFRLMINRLKIPSVVHWSRYGIVP